jgi:hypothetical protein
MAADTSASQHQLVSAKYNSPTNAAFTHTQKIPTPPSDKPSDRTAYLGALRKATAAMQEHINKELTQRMEEDKAKEAEGVNGASNAKAHGMDESREEDNYGEEVPEEDWKYVSWFFLLGVHLKHDIYTLLADIERSNSIAMYEYVSQILPHRHCPDLQASMPALLVLFPAPARPRHP